MAAAAAVLELGRRAKVRVRHDIMGGCSHVGRVAGHDSVLHALRGCLREEVVLFRT